MLIARKKGEVAASEASVIPAVMIPRGSLLCRLDQLLGNTGKTHSIEARTSRKAAKYPC